MQVRIFSHRYSSSRRPYARRWITRILLFKPSTNPSETCSLVCSRRRHPNVDGPIDQESRADRTQVTVAEPEGKCDLPTGDRNDPARVLGLVDSAIGVAFAIDAESMGDPLQRRAPAHGVGPGIPRFARRSRPTNNERSRHHSASKNGCVRPIEYLRTTVLH